MTFNSSSPPPSPRWWLTREGKPEGPFEQSLILGWIQEGRLESSSLACPEGAQQWKPLSSWPQFTVSISQKVNTSDQIPVSARETQSPQLVGPTAQAMPVSNDLIVRRQVVGPAVGLMVTGGFTTLMGLLYLPGILFPDLIDPQLPWDPVDLVLNIVFMLFTLSLGVATLFGSIKMMRCESYALAMVAAITAMVPWYCCLLGLPMGIWAIVVLRDPEVRQVFK